jgi:type IV pilus assembly protein PilM
MLFSSKKVLGLDIGTSSVKMAELEESGKRWTLNRFSIVPLPNLAVQGGDIADPVTVAETIASVAAILKSKRKNVCAGLWGSSVIVKKITMPKMEEKLVAEQIKWEAEQYIPFDLNEISLEHQILKNSNSSGETMDVLLVAAKHDFVFRYVETIQTANLTTVCLDVNAFALANCFTYNYGTQPDTVALLDIGASVANFVVLERGEVIFSRDLPIGGLNYTGDIQRLMGVSEEEAESLKLSASMGHAGPQEVVSQLQTTTEAMMEEIRNGFDFYNTTSGGSPIRKIYLTGGCILVPGLVSGIQGSIGLPCEALDPFTKITFNNKNISADYLMQLRPIASVALGLGMREQDDS